MTDPLFILLIGILIVVGGIIILRLHAFLALLLGALIVAILTPESSIFAYADAKGMSSEAARLLADSKAGVRVAGEFGKTCGKIGILIAMASIIGKCLLESGGAEKIVRSMLRRFGVGNTPITFLVSSFFIGIPVFFDTVFYLMVPLAKAMALKLKKNYLLLIMAITAGAAMANSLVPPTPGPLFLVSELNIPIGMMMIGGIVIGLGTIFAGYGYAKWANNKWPIPLRESIDAPISSIQLLAERDEKKLPSLSFAVLPILIPIVLITLRAIIVISDSSDMPSSIAYQFIDFFGEKNMALICGAITALMMLAIHKKNDKESLAKSVQAAIMSAGVIILITSAGGAFGGMLQQTGISLRIGELTQGYQMALIPLAFFITAIVRTAQGSATVAMITASGILAGMATTLHLEFHPLYVGLAIACGSKLVPWMNDSGFWIICKMSNLTEREALKTYTPLLSIMGLTGLVMIMIGAKMLPLV